jgi:hypothetical protein
MKLSERAALLLDSKPATSDAINAKDAITPRSVAERGDAINEINAKSPLEARRDTLYGRLDAGYVKIERGLREGANVTDWEDLWLALLNEYERVCDDLMAIPAHVEQVPTQGALFRTTRREGE